MDGYGLRRAEDWSLQRAWSSARPEQSLAVPIGIDEYGKTFLFDVLYGKDGVHGLVGGTTGSGKSEMLQTWILSMAMHFSPQDVSFVIVDFKGSGLLSPFERLPHLAGAISNLDMDIRRNADSLQHEIERREALFKKHSVQRISEYWRKERETPDIERLPLLIVAIDEFAMLQKTFSYFTGIVEKNYTLGSSLGIWFVLATQQPASISSAAIKENTHYKWLLKVPSASVSRDTIGIPDAAQISRPGRAYVYVSNSKNARKLTLVQSFWSGARYDPNAASSQQRIAFVDLTGQRSYAEAKEDRPDRNSTTQIEQLVGYIRKYTDENHIPDAKRVWQEKLPVRFALAQLRPEPERAGCLCPAIGIIDDPKNQAQYPLCADFTGSGHMAVYGAPVTGKTTFLQTLMMALVTQYTPDEVQIYAMDFGSYGLRAFAGFPHVGGIADAEEDEKLKRLAKLLTQEQARRKKLFASLGIGSIRSYRQMERLEQLKPLPEIVLVADNFRAVLEQYPELESFFLELVQKGANFGLYLAASVAGSNTLPMKYNDSIKTVFTLWQTDQSKYSDLVGRTDGLYPEEHVGRGLVKGKPPMEFQIALPANGENDAEITVNIKRLAAKQRKAWNGACAAPIPIMPDKITAEDIPGDQIMLGLFKDTIEPAVYDEKQQFYFLISAVEEKRGHEMLMLLAQQMKDKRGCEIWCFDPAQSCAQLQENAEKYLTSSEACDRVIADLMPVMSERKQKKQRDPQAVFAPLLLVIADYDRFHEIISEKTAERMELLLRLSQGLGVYILAECSADKLVRLGALDTIKIMQRGGQAVLLGGCIEQHYGFQTDSLNLSYAQKNTAVQKDEGFFLKDGRLRIFKAITAQEKEV